VKAQRVHRSIVGHCISGVAVDLHHHACIGIGEKMNVRGCGVVPDDPHPEVLDIPRRHGGGVRYVAREVFDVQRWHLGS
jgi:hypothetical protein